MYAKHTYIHPPKQNYIMVLFMEQLGKRALYIHTHTHIYTDTYSYVYTEVHIYTDIQTHTKYTYMCVHT